MIGIVDAGNTQVKIAVFDSNQILKHAVYKGFDNYFIQFILSNNITTIFISNVIDVPKLVLNHNQFSAILLNSSHKLPIKNAYNSPESLGNDRLANACGAFVSNNNSGPVLSIDMGTCIKFDFVDENANYLGGSISPGFEMRLKALNYYTQKLPIVEVKEIPKLIGTTSNESIASGVANGIIAEINDFVSQYIHQYPSIKVFLTGGDAPFFFDSLKNNIFAFPLLTMHGLNAIAKFNGIS